MGVEKTSKRVVANATEEMKWDSRRRKWGFTWEQSRWAFFFLSRCFLFVPQATKFPRCWRNVIWGLRSSYLGCGDGWHVTRHKLFCRCTWRSQISGRKRKVGELQLSVKDQDFACTQDLRLRPKPTQNFLGYRFQPKEGFVGHSSRTEGKICCWSLLFVWACFLLYCCILAH